MQLKKVFNTPLVIVMLVSSVTMGWSGQSAANCSAVFRNGAVNRYFSPDGDTDSGIVALDSVGSCGNRICVNGRIKFAGSPYPQRFEINHDNMNYSGLIWDTSGNRGIMTGTCAGGIGNGTHAFDKTPRVIHRHEFR